MTMSSLRTLLAVLPLCTLSATLVVPLEATAQQPWPGEQQAQPAAPAQPAQGQRARSRAPAPPVGEEDQLSPRQMEAAPAANPGRRRPTAQAAPPAAGGATAAAPAAAARPAPPHAPARSIACSGVFGKDSNHLKLAMAFEARNITFTQVDGPEGTRLNASVVFPNDPKRRIEVLWNNDAARSDTSLIVIGGQSQWAAPKGLKLGMPLAALEKANGKPVKLRGLDQPDGGSVLDWNGGALDSLPGGCKVGVRLAADPKANEAARSAAAGKELTSSDAALKAARLGIVEIILGY